MIGWIKLHRKLLEWEWYGDGHTVRVFLHLLLTANYEDGRYRGHDVPRGSAVSGYDALAKTLGISVQNVRTAFEHLKSTGEITVKVTGKFSIVALVKYEEYQIKDDEVTGKVTGSLTVNQQAANSQVTASKEYKNKERKKEESVHTHARGWKDVFEEVLSLNSDKPLIANYKAMYEFIERRKGTHLLALRDAVMDYEEFAGLVKYATENNVKINDLISEMINKPGLFPASGRDKKVSLYLTLNSWMRREVKLKEKMKA